MAWREINSERKMQLHRWVAHSHVNFFFVCQEFPSHHSIRYCVCANMYNDIYWYNVKIIIIFCALCTIRINRTRKRMCVCPPTIRICIAHIIFIHPFTHPAIHCCVHSYTCTSTYIHMETEQKTYVLNAYICPTDLSIINIIFHLLSINVAQMVIYVWWNRIENQNRLQHRCNNASVQRLLQTKQCSWTKMEQKVSKCVDVENNKSFWRVTLLNITDWNHQSQICKISKKSDHPIPITYGLFSISIKLSTLCINFNWIACDVEFNKLFPTLHSYILGAVSMRGHVSVCVHAIHLQGIGSVTFLSLHICAFLLRRAALSPSLCTY